MVSGQDMPRDGRQVQPLVQIIRRVRGWWGRSDVEAEDQSVGQGPDHYGSYQSTDVAATELEPFYNIAQAGSEWSAQSSDRAPGPMGKGFGQWRSQVHLVRATKAYLYTQALDTPFIKTTKF